MSRIKDLTGQRFGRLVVLRLLGTRECAGGYWRAVYECKCDCGNIVDKIGSNLSRGSVKSCGCLAREWCKESINNMPNVQKYSGLDISGNKYGRLTVLRKAPDSIGKTGRNTKKWTCLCECGTEKDIPQYSLIHGTTSSCGCIAIENAKLKNITHGLSDTPLYHVWEHMIGRCTNENDLNYKDYGGRGIKICTCLPDFETFYQWAQNSGYTEHLTIERIEVNGNYCICHNNLKWIPKSEQAWNQRPQHRSKTGVRGVMRRHTGKYQAMIGVKGERYYLGSFETLEEAATVKKEAEERLWVSEI